MRAYRALAPPTPGPGRRPARRVGEGLGLAHPAAGLRAARSPMWARSCHTPPGLRHQVVDAVGRAGTRPGRASSGRRRASWSTATSQVMSWPCPGVERDGRPGRGRGRCAATPSTAGGARARSCRRSRSTTTRPRSEAAEARRPPTPPPPGPAPGRGRRPARRRKAGVAWRRRRHQHLGPAVVVDAAPPPSPSAVRSSSRKGRLSSSSLASTTPVNGHRRQLVEPPPAARPRQALRRPSSPQPRPPNAGHRPT